MHSDYLEVIVGTGIWGLIPLLAALGAAWWFLLNYIRDPADPGEPQLAHEGLAILALLTFRSFSNNMMTIHPPLPFLAIVGYGEFLRRRRTATSRQRVRVTEFRVLSHGRVGLPSRGHPLPP